jgi:4-amino-4-deoxy-L-arabinose transferase-like glycosyltransferase
LGELDKMPPSPQAPAARRASGELVPLFVILLVFFVLAGVYLSRPGLAWDEALQIPFAEIYRGWFAGLPGTLNSSDLDNSLGRFASHPPLAEYEMGLAIGVFGNSMGRLYAARVSSVVQMAMLLVAVYFFTLRTVGPVAAASASAFLVLLPNVFAFSILSTIDMPMAFLWFASAALFYAAMENRRLAWLAGLVMALAFLTKVNAIALPVVLWPWGLIFHRKKALPAIFWSLVLVPVLFVALWPFLWRDTFINLGKYFGEKFSFVVSAYSAMGIDLKSAGDAAHKMIRRTDVTVLYFGRVFTSAPWHYPFVMTAVTTPLVVLAAAFLGLFALRRPSVAPRLAAFLLWNVLFWPLAFAVGLSRPYDGTRLFLAIFPFVAILAGIGVQFAWQYLRKLTASRIAAGLAAALVALPLAVSFVRYEPFGLSYYNALVGGLPGAAEKGLPVTSWGETADWEITSYIDAHAPEGARLAAFPMDELYVQNMRYFGLVRPDIRDVSVADDWDYLIIANRGDALASREDIRALIGSAVVRKEILGVPAAWLVEKKR